jgi:hypothetical protein
VLHYEWLCYCSSFFVPSLTKKAQALATKIGKVDVYTGETACKVPLATAYIQKVLNKGRLRKKRDQVNFYV